MKLRDDRKIISRKKRTVFGLVAFFFILHALPFTAYAQTTKILRFYEGELIRTENEHKVYIISSGRKIRWIRTIDVFNSYNFKWEDVRVVPPVVLTVFEFTNLIRQQGDEKVYLINKSGFKRHIPSPQVFTSYGFDWKDVVLVPGIEVQSYPESRLIRKEGDTKVYYLENNTKRWVTSAESFNSHNFDWNEIQVVNDTEESFFKDGDTITQKSPAPLPPPAEEPIVPEKEPTKEKPREEVEKKEITVELPTATTTEPVAATTTEAVPPTIEPEAETPAPSGGGGGGGPPTSAADTTSPAAITDLSASNPTISSIDLSWTSSGDDGGTGTATSYDMRYSTSNITDANWSSATQATEEPAPQTAGSSESMTISGLSSGTTYYFAIKTTDEVPNESSISNVVNLATTSPPPQCSFNSSGSQSYNVSSGSGQPRISTLNVNPFDVQPGVTQIVTITVTDADGNSITQVTGSVQTDNGSTPFTLSLSSGTDTNGTWQGSWSSSDTLCTNYTVSITATSASGQRSVALSFK